MIPTVVGEERVARLIRKTLQSKPRDGSTHWSVRSAARESGISKSSVQRYFDLFGVHASRTSYVIAPDGKIIYEHRAQPRKACRQYPGGR